MLEVGGEAAGSSLVISTTTLEPGFSTAVTVSNLQPVNVCELPKSLGTCLILSFCYFYDSTTNSCKRFRFGSLR